MTDTAPIERLDGSRTRVAEGDLLPFIGLGEYDSRRILREGFRANIELDLGGVALHPALIELVRASLVGRWAIVVPEDGHLTVNYSIASGDAAAYEAADDFAASLSNLLGADGRLQVEIWASRSSRSWRKTN